jgi:Helix-turn-helix domain
MPDGSLPRRVRPTMVAQMTSLSVRKVQEMAAAGQIPGAAKIGGVWTFDPDKVLAWTEHKKRLTCRASRETYTDAATSGGAASRLPAPSIDAAYSRLIQGKRRGASKAGANS